MVKHTLTPGMSQRQVVPAWNREKGLLLLRLYGKAMQCMDEAVNLIDAGDVVGKSDQLIRAQDIVLQLSDALDTESVDPMARSITTNLERLYLYIYRRLIHGNLSIDRGAVLEARRLMQTLYSAWSQAVADGPPTLEVQLAR
jgi:flagellar protein FliS